MDATDVRCHSEGMQRLAGRGPLTALAVAGAAGLVFASVAGVTTPGPFGIRQPQVWALVALLPGYLTGLVLTGIRPAERIPRLLLAMTASMAIATALGAASSRMLAGGSDRAGWLCVLTVGEYVADIAGPAAMGTLFLLFPDGRVRRRYERVVLRVFLAALVALPILLMLTHSMLPAPEYAASRTAQVANPLFWPALGAIGPAVVVGYQIATQFGLVGAVLLVVLRYRRLPTRQRLQTYWLLLAAIGVLADVAVVQLLGGYGVLPTSVRVTTFYAVWVPLLALLPVAIVVAVLRAQVLDVHLVVRRSLLYGAVSTAIGVAFLVVATAFGVTAGQRLPLVATVLVTVVVVLVLSPVRRRLNRWAGARVYGERPTSAQLLGNFGETLEHAYDLRELGPRAAAMIVDGLGVSWARLSLILPGSNAAEQIGCAGTVPEQRSSTGAIPKPLGSAATTPVSDVAQDPTGTKPADPSDRPANSSDDGAAELIPLIDRDEIVGHIECGPPARGGTLGPEDRQLLLTVARQTALAVRNAHYAAELAGRLAETQRQAVILEESRRRLVDAQDTERRRLERDLHDGVQQQVVAVTTLLRLALNQWARDPAAAKDTVEDARRTAVEMLAGLRDLVQGIRPPVLADQGLLAAVEARTARVPIGVVIDAGPRMRTARFGTELESAAYFLVTEALTNVLKHAHASQVRVWMRIQGDLLRLRISDDGVGFVPADGAGTGLTGLADRIGAVGGQLHVQSRPEAGTRLEASLPIPRTADV
jgi:signal transduction histidine kinase